MNVDDILNRGVPQRVDHSIQNGQWEQEIIVVDARLSENE